MIDPQGLRARARVLAAVRTWFGDHGYLEVPTPVLVRSAAMEEHLFPLRAGEGFLRTSPEFALKRVVAAGLPRIYEIGPCFRGREQGAWHGTEFTMLEWYRVGAGLIELQQEVRELVAVAAAALGRPGPDTWHTATIASLFEPVVPLDRIEPEAGSWDTAFFRLWVDRIEPGLPRACFVTDWPASQAALAEVRDDRTPAVTQRFEAYLNGVELANAFLELRDGTEQLARFVDSNRKRAEAGEPENPVDHALCEAVDRLPPVAGIALGVDRLVAALLEEDGIECVRVPCS